MQNLVLFPIFQKLKVRHSKVMLLGKKKHESWRVETLKFNFTLIIIIKITKDWHSFGLGGSILFLELSWLTTFTFRKNFLANLVF